MVGANVDLFIGEGIDRFWDNSAYPWLKRKVKEWQRFERYGKRALRRKRGYLVFGRNVCNIILNVSLRSFTWRPRFSFVIAHPSELTEVRIYVLLLSTFSQQQNQCLSIVKAKISVDSILEKSVYLCLFLTLYYFHWWERHFSYN